MTLWTVAARPLSPWSSPSKNTGVGCHDLPPGDLLDSRIESASPALEGRYFTTEPPVKPSSLLIPKIGVIIVSTLRAFGKNH